MFITSITRKVQQKIYGNAWQKCTKAHHTPLQILCGVQDKLGGAIISWLTAWVLVLCTRTNLQILLIGWSYFLYCHFFLYRWSSRHFLCWHHVKYADHVWRCCEVCWLGYVLENYIGVDVKFPSALWAQPPDVSGATPYPKNGAAAYLCWNAGWSP